MSDNYLTEAFSQLRLQEQDFDMTSADIGKKDELKAFIADDIEEPVEEEIIDVTAETDDDLQDSYIGKVITECNCCHSRYYEEKEDIIVTEDGFANVDKECPVCHQQCGYTIIGEIKPYDANDYEVEITKKINLDNEEDLDEGFEDRKDIKNRLKKTTRKFMKEGLSDDEDNSISARLKRVARKFSRGSSKLGESIQDATIETDEDIIKLSATKKDGYDQEEMIAPIDNLDDFNFEGDFSEGDEFTEDENQLPEVDGDDFDVDATENINDEELPEDEEEETFEESYRRKGRRKLEDFAWIDTRDDDDAIDNSIDIDELDTEKYDDLYEKVLNKNLKGDKKYKTTKVVENKDKLVVEGCVKTNAGKKKTVKTSLKQKGSSDGDTVVLEGFSSVTPNLFVKLTVPCRIKENLMKPIQMGYKIYSKSMRESRNNKTKLIKGIIR